MSAFKQYRYRLEELGCRILVRGIPRLPRLTCVRLANALGALAFLLDRKGRATALANLSCTFGDRYSPAQRVQIARASYQNFVRTMLDLFWAQRLTAQNYPRWLHVEGFDRLRERLDREKRGMVLMCVHQGNWEWASLAFGFLGMPTTIVAENFKNPRLTAIFSSLRQISGHTIIPQENSMLRLFKVAMRNSGTGMLIDLSLKPSGASTVIEGFGLKMCVPLLHAVLARRTRALLVPVETRPMADGSCRVIIHPEVRLPAEASLQEIAQRCWEAFVPALTARPGEYLWPYKHFRFRPAGAQRPYPAYANESAKFEKALAAASQPPEPEGFSGRH